MTTTTSPTVPARPRALAGIRSARVIVASIVLVGSPGARAAEEERFTGVARGRDGAVLYTEEHVVELGGGRPRTAVTTYRDRSGSPIAELHTDFSADLFAPGYTFTDLRTGVSESAAVGGDVVRLEAAGRARTLPRPAGLATGQGLDRLVREQLAALAGGEELRVRYAIPGRLDTYEFRIRAQPEGERVHVRVELASFFLRLIAPELRVDYDRATGRLLRYRGASNLAFGEGENPEVEITYAYPVTVVAAGEGAPNHGR